MKPTEAFAYTGPEPRPPFYKHLYVKVLAAIFIGVVLGVISPSDVKNVPAWQQPFLLLPPGWGEAMKPLGDGFIKLIKMMIAPDHLLHGGARHRQHEEHEARSAASASRR